MAGEGGNLGAEYLLGFAVDPNSFEKINEGLQAGVQKAVEVAIPVVVTGDVSGLQASIDKAMVLDPRFSKESLAKLKEAVNSLFNEQGFTGFGENVDRFHTATGVFNAAVEGLKSIDPSKALMGVAETINGIKTLLEEVRQSRSALPAAPSVAVAPAAPVAPLAPPAPAGGGTPPSNKNNPFRPFTPAELEREAKKAEQLRVRLSEAEARAFGQGREAFGKGSAEYLKRFGAPVQGIEKEEYAPFPFPGLPANLAYARVTASGRAHRLGDLTNSVSIQNIASSHKQTVKLDTGRAGELYQQYDTAYNAAAGRRETLEANKKLQAQAPPTTAKDGYQAVQDAIRNLYGERLALQKAFNAAQEVFDKDLLGYGNAATIMQAEMERIAEAMKGKDANSLEYRALDQEMHQAQNAAQTAGAARDKQQSAMVEMREKLGYNRAELQGFAKEEERLSATLQAEKRQAVLAALPQKAQDRITAQRVLQREQAQQQGESINSAMKLVPTGAMSTPGWEMLTEDGKYRVARKYKQTPLGQEMTGSITDPALRTRIEFGPDGGYALGEAKKKFKKAKAKVSGSYDKLDELDQSVELISRDEKGWTNARTRALDKGVAATRQLIHMLDDPSSPIYQESEKILAELNRLKGQASQTSGDKEMIRYFEGILTWRKDMSAILAQNAKGLESELEAMTTSAPPPAALAEGPSKWRHTLLGPRRVGDNPLVTEAGETVDNHLLDAKEQFARFNSQRNTARLQRRKLEGMPETQEADPEAFQTKRFTTMESGIGAIKQMQYLLENPHSPIAIESARFKEEMDALEAKAAAGTPHSPAELETLALNKATLAHRENLGNMLRAQAAELEMNIGEKPERPVSAAAAARDPKWRHTLLGPQEAGHNPLISEVGGQVDLDLYAAKAKFFRYNTRRESAKQTRDTLEGTPEAQERDPAAFQTKRFTAMEGGIGAIRQMQHMLTDAASPLAQETATIEAELQKLIDANTGTDKDNALIARWKAVLAHRDELVRQLDTEGAELEENIGEKPEAGGGGGKAKAAGFWGGLGKRMGHAVQYYAMFQGISAVQGQAGVAFQNALGVEDQIAQLRLSSGGKNFKGGERDQYEGQVRKAARVLSVQYDRSQQEVIETFGSFYRQTDKNDSAMARYAVTIKALIPLMQFLHVSHMDASEAMESVTAAAKGLNLTYEQMAGVYGKIIKLSEGSSASFGGSSIGKRTPGNPEQMLGFLGEFGVVGQGLHFNVDQQIGLGQASVDYQTRTGKNIGSAFAKLFSNLQRSKPILARNGINLDLDKDGAFNRVMGNLPTILKLSATSGESFGLNPQETTDLRGLAKTNFIKEVYKNVAISKKSGASDSDKAEAILADSTSQKLKRAQREFEDFGIIMAQKVLPAVVGVIEVIERLVHALEHTSPALQTVGKVILGGLGIVAALNILGMVVERAKATLMLLNPALTTVGASLTEFLGTGIAAGFILAAVLAGIAVAVAKIGGNVRALDQQKEISAQAKAHGDAATNVAQLNAFGAKYQRPTSDPSVESTDYHAKALFDKQDAQMENARQLMIDESVKHNKGEGQNRLGDAWRLQPDYWMFDDRGKALRKAAMFRQTVAGLRAVKSPLADEGQPLLDLMDSRLPWGDKVGTAKLNPAEEGKLDLFLGKAVPKMPHIKLPGQSAFVDDGMKTLGLDKASLAKQRKEGLESLMEGQKAIEKQYGKSSFPNMGGTDSEPQVDPFKNRQEEFQRRAETFQAALTAILEEQDIYRRKTELTAVAVDQLAESEQHLSQLYQGRDMPTAALQERLKLIQEQIRQQYVLVEVTKQQIGVNRLTQTQMGQLSHYIPTFRSIAAPTFATIQGGKPVAVPQSTGYEQAISGLAAEHRLKVVSAVRPGSTIKHGTYKGQPGLHSVGQAWDLQGTPADMAAAALDWRLHHPETHEIIYSPTTSFYKGNPHYVPSPELLNEHWMGGSPKGHLHVGMGTVAGGMLDHPWYAPGSKKGVPGGTNLGPIGMAAPAEAPAVMEGVYYQDVQKIMQKVSTLKTSVRGINLADLFHGPVEQVHMARETVAMEKSLKAAQGDTAVKIAQELANIQKTNHHIEDLFNQAAEVQAQMFLRPLDTALVREAEDLRRAALAQRDYQEAVDDTALRLNLLGNTHEAVGFKIKHANADLALYTAQLPAAEALYQRRRSDYEAVQAIDVAQLASDKDFANHDLDSQKNAIQAAGKKRGKHYTDAEAGGMATKEFERGPMTQRVLASLGLPAAEAGGVNAFVAKYGAALSKIEGGAAVVQGIKKRQSFTSADRGFLGGAVGKLGRADAEAYNAKEAISKHIEELVNNLQALGKEFVFSKYTRQIEAAAFAMAKFNGQVEIGQKLAASVGVSWERTTGAVAASAQELDLIQTQFDLDEKNKQNLLDWKKKSQPLYNQLSSQGLAPEDIAAAMKENAKKNGSQYALNPDEVDKAVREIDLAQLGRQGRQADIFGQRIAVRPLEEDWLTNIKMAQFSYGRQMSLSHLDGQVDGGAAKRREALDSYLSGLLSDATSNVQKWQKDTFDNQNTRRSFEGTVAGAKDMSDADRIKNHVMSKADEDATRSDLDQKQVEITRALNLAKAQEVMLTERAIKNEETRFYQQSIRDSLTDFALNKNVDAKGKNGGTVLGERLAGFFNDLGQKIFQRQIQGRIDKMTERVFDKILPMQKDRSPEGVARAANTTATTGNTTALGATTEALNTLTELLKQMTDAANGDNGQSPDDGSGNGPDSKIDGQASMETYDNPDGAAGSGSTGKLSPMNNKGQGTWQAKDVLGAFGSAYGAYQAGANAGHGVVGALMGTVEGAEIGAQFGPVGMGVGAVVGLLGNIFGSSKEQKTVMERIFNQMPRRQDVLFAASQYLPFSAYAGGRQSKFEFAVNLNGMTINDMAHAQALGQAVTDNIAPMLKAQIQRGPILRRGT